MGFRELANAACLNIGEKVKGGARRLLVVGCALVAYRPRDCYDPFGAASRAVDDGRALADVIIREACR